MAVNMTSQTIQVKDNWLKSGNSYVGDQPDGSSLVSIASRFHPDKGDTWINWDYPRYAYPSLDVDYKFTGYDWENRTLSWSITSAPSTVNAASINSTSGLFSWTPDATEDGNDYEFTVRMSAGSTTVDKTFTIQVRTAKFIFCDWATGVDSATGRGAIGAPYKSVRYAMTQEAVDGTGQVYMVRGGTSNEHHNYVAVGAVDHPLGAFTTNTADTPILTRNYPGETVTNDCTGLGGSYVANCPYSIIYGLNAANLGTSGIGMFAGTTAVAKKCRADDNDANFGLNPSGFRYHAGAVLDMCEAANNLYSTGGNSQDYVGFMDEGTGDSYLIDCISSGPDSGTTKQTTAFRSKHPADWDATDYQGEYKTFFHRCVANNPLSSGYGAVNLNAGDSVRHSVVVFDGYPVVSTATQAEIGRPGTLTASLYSLSQGNLFCSAGTTVGTTIANFTDRFLFYNDEFYTESGFNPFKIESLSSYTYAGFDFQSTTFYADADSWIYATVDGTTYNFAALNVASTGETDPAGGQNNTREAIPATVSKVAAGKTWTWNGTTLSGVDL